MGKELGHAYRACDADDMIRVVVLTGAGRAFCAGLDVANFGRFAAEDPEALIMPRTHGLSNAFQRVSMVWRDVPVPVIATVPPLVSSIDQE